MHVLQQKRHTIEPYTISSICGGVSLTKDYAGEDFICYKLLQVTV